MTARRVRSHGAERLIPNDRRTKTAQSPHMATGWISGCSVFVVHFHLMKARHSFGLGIYASERRTLKDTNSGRLAQTDALLQSSGEQYRSKARSKTPTQKRLGHIDGRNMTKKINRSSSRSCSLKRISRIASLEDVLSRCALVICPLRSS